MRTKATVNELIAHPVRLRILGALAGREITVEAIARLLDDVPMPSLYRHVNALIEGGQIVIVEEKRQRGGSQRVLGLAQNAGRLDFQEIDPHSVAENGYLVDTFFTRQMAGFASAIRDEEIEPSDWTLQGVVAYLTKDEEAQLMGQIRDFISQRLDLPKEGRRRRTLITGSLPDRELKDE